MSGAETDASQARRPVLEISGLEQRLFDPQRGEEFVVFVSDKISILSGSFVAILGPSGCGKTTLLTVLGLLRAPSHPDRLASFFMWTRGEEGIVEHDLKAAWKKRRERQIEQLRRGYLGFALQSGELLGSLTVRENIAAPLRLNGVDRLVRRRRVGELLATFGLAGKNAEGCTDTNGCENEAAYCGRIARSRVNKLSGGEYQRVALARAIVHRPCLVFVDEPTAALNRELARGALQQLGRLQREAGHSGATIMITHDEELADEFADTTIRMAPMKHRPAGEVVEIIHKDPDRRLLRTPDGDSALCEQT